MNIRHSRCFRLFWAQGVDGTIGDQIAEAVGLSTRTIWRHFRSKENCAEPIVAQNVEWELATLRSWPLHRSLEEHFTTEARRLVSEISPSEQADADLSGQLPAGLAVRRGSSHHGLITDSQFRRWRNGNPGLEATRKVPS
ncbi:helix-turn-helix domain-containing protein [Streptomyces sp. NPDC000349]|uniref:helix-turn-helix domain-containing protein n=1 Tax=Streptomyces sp. NPDC000349 TaxID=3154249 RepID=UPI00336A151E